MRLWAEKKESEVRLLKEQGCWHLRGALIPLPTATEEEMLAIL